MLKFFRKIRQNLLLEGKTATYFKYAIGEIVLVVIGILIALSINNWNENRKDNIIGKKYLQGIKEDLKKDLVLIDSILKINKQSLSIISSIDSVFHKKHYYNTGNYPNLFGKPDTLDFETVFYRNTSFRSINGTYKSLISDGKSGIIKNKELFQKIQHIYNENHERLASSYEVIKNIEQRISWAYPLEKQHWTYSNLKMANGKKIFADLVWFTDEKYWHCLNLLRIKGNSKEVISLIDKEIGNAKIL